MPGLVALYGIGLCALMLVLVHTVPPEQLAACVEPGAWNSTVLPD